jgi:DNA-binding winged helix-turn-helix (wHTH) protein
MQEPVHPAIRRFGRFELNVATGELRRQGIRVRLNAQSFQVLKLLVEQPGELVTREQLQRDLWPEGTFVDFEHGLNSAVNRIREALGDSAANPRFVETLARRGYRFLAPVTRDGAASEANSPAIEEPVEPRSLLQSVLSEDAELPRTTPALPFWLLLLLQLMYLSFYVGALANLPEIDELLHDLTPHAATLFVALIVTAAAMIPVRLYLLTLLGFRSPLLREKYRKLFPVLLPMDGLWSLSPFLLLHHMNMGVALAATAALLYSPFAQRSLVLMRSNGERAKAGGEERQQG